MAAPLPASEIVRIERAALRSTEHALWSAYGSDYLVTGATGLSLPDGRDVRPDLHVLRGDVYAFCQRDPSPHHVALLVDLWPGDPDGYARTPYTEYWILHPFREELWAYRKVAWEFEWEKTDVFGSGDVVHPPFLAHAVEVADLFFPS